MLILYGINNCDTIKRTKSWLTDHGVEFHFHDYKKAGCSVDLAKEFLRHFAYQDLINTRGTTWRKLTATEKAELNADSAIVLMNTQTSIIKRPLLQNDSDWLLGYDEEKLAHFCLNQ